MNYIYLIERIVYYLIGKTSMLKRRHVLINKKLHVVLHLLLFTGIFFALQPTIEVEASSANVVQDGLVMNVDVSNPNSFVAGQARINDLTGNTSGLTLHSGVLSNTGGGSVADSLTTGLTYNDAQEAIYFSPHQFAMTGNLGTYFNVNSKSVTYEMWVRLDASSNGVLLTERDTDASVSPVWYDTTIEVSGVTSYQRIWNSTAATTSATIARNTWQHLVMTYDHSTTTSKIFVDGVQIDDASYTRVLEPANGEIYFGLFMAQPRTNLLNNAGYLDGMSGYLREFRMYDRALTSGEVTSNYEETRRILPDSLLLHLDAGDLNSYSSFGSTWKDLTTFGHDATLSGVDFVTTPLSSFVFNSNDDVISINNLETVASPQAVTIEQWVNANNWQVNVSGSSIQTLISTSAYNITLGNGGSLQFTLYLEGGTSQTLGFTPRGLTGWQHITATYDGARMRLYINGNLRASKVVTGNLINTSSSEMLLGAMIDEDITPQSLRRLAGKIAQVRLYSDALTAPEIMKNYKVSQELFADYFIDTQAERFLFTTNGTDTETPVAPNVTIRTNNAAGIDVVRVMITNAISGDRLALRGTHSGITADAFSTATNSIIIRNSDPTNIQGMLEALRSVVFFTSNDNQTARTVTFTIGEAIPNPDNGHFYNLVKSPLNHVNALAAAANLNYYGVPGYMVTITSASENTFILNKIKEQNNGVAVDVWFALRAPSTGAREWRWIAGPESTENEATGRLAATGNTPVTVVNANYNNWAGGEPNNAGTNGEQVGQFYGSNNGLWNDLNETNRSLNYLVEYGWNNGDTDALISTITLDHTTDGFYSISYVTNGGSLSNPLSYFLSTDTSVDLPVPTRSGYSFDGWYDNAELTGSSIAMFDGTVRNANQTFYAKWVEEVYNITYVLNSGVVSTPNPATYTVATSTFTLNAPTRDYYDFGGWYFNADFSGDPVVGIVQGTIGAKTLHAKFTPTIYEITYNLNSGLLDVASTPFIYTSGTVTLEIPTRPGYTFEGWFTDSLFTGSAITTIESNPPQNLDVYAKWIPAPLVAPSYEFIRTANDVGLRLFSTDSGINPTFAGIEYSIDGSGYTTYTTIISLSGVTSLIARPLDTDLTIQDATVTVEFVDVNYFSGVTKLFSETVVSGLVDYRPLDLVPTPAGLVVMQWYTSEARDIVASGLTISGETNLYGSTEVGIYETTSGLINQASNFGLTSANIGLTGQITISSSQMSAEDSLSILSADDPYEFNAISVEEGVVYIGLGNGEKQKIAAISQQDNGLNGNNLTLLVDALLYNGDFEAGIDGWTVSTALFDVPSSTAIVYSGIINQRFLEGRINNGTIFSVPTTIASNVLTNLSMDRDAPSLTSYVGTSTVTVVTIAGSLPTNGSKAARLVISSTTRNVATGIYGNVHGPTITSDNYFSAVVGDKINFDFLAISAADAADVYAFVIDETDISNPRYIPIFYQRADRGKSSYGVLEYQFTATDLPNGSSSKLRYFFVGGSYDENGATGLGSEFRIDNIRLVSANALTTDKINRVLNNLVLDTQNPNPADIYSFEVSAEGQAGVIESGLINIAIKEVNNPMLLSGLNEIYYNSGQVINFDLNTRIVDQDSESIVFSSSNVPSLLRLESSGILSMASGQAYTLAQEGIYNFTVRATDGQYTLDQPMILYLNYQNDAPVSNPDVALDNLTLPIDYSSGVQLNSTLFTDADLRFKDVLTLTTTVSPSLSCMSYNADLNRLIFNSCNAANGAVHTVTLTATDLAGATATRTFTITFSAVIEYTLTFNSNGGDAVTAIVAEEDDAITAPSDPTRLAYYFAGWFSNPELTNSFDFASGMPGADTTVYAKWTPVEYSITYTLYGGTNGANPPTYTIESGITFLDPSRTGYTFAGWYADADYSNPKSSISVGTYGDVTLYAKWTPIDYAITYELNGGTNGANPSTYTIEDTIIFASPSRVGYIFAGWHTDNTLTIPISSIPVGSINAITIHAKWTPIDYAITYELNGGVNGANPSTYTIEDVVTYSSGTRRGYDFVGWFSDEALTTPTTGITLGTIEPITIYAKWIPIVYTITYEEIGVGGFPATYTIEDETIIIGSPTRPGLIFGGWSPQGVIEAGSIGDRVFTAQWSARMYNLTIIADGKVITRSSIPFSADLSTLDLGLPPAKEGYESVGWDTPLPGQMPASNLTIRAVYQINSYTFIALDDEGNELANTQVEFKSAVPLPSPPEKEGYTFSGWGDAPGSMPASDVTVQAEYEINSYPVTFVDSEGNTLGSIEVEFEAPITPIEAPEIEGFVFVEWGEIPGSMPAEPVTVIGVYEEAEVEEEETEEEAEETQTPQTPIITPTIPGGGNVTIRPVVPQTPTDEQPSLEEIVIDPTPVNTRVKVDGVELNVSIIPGVPVGRLPEAQLVGYNFTGWMNAVTGEVITEETVFTDPTQIVLLPLFEKQPNLLDAARNVFETIVVNPFTKPVTVNDNTTRTDNIQATTEYGVEILDTVVSENGTVIEVRADGTALIRLENEKTPITIDVTQFDASTIDVYYYVGQGIPEQDNDNWVAYHGEPFLTNAANQSVYIKVQDASGTNQVTYLKEATFISNPELIPVRDIVSVSETATSIDDLIISKQTTFVTQVEYDGELLDLFVIDPNQTQDLESIVVRYRANEHNEDFLLDVNAAVWQTRTLTTERLGIFIKEGDNLAFNVEYRFTNQESVIEEFNVTKANTLVNVVVTPEPNLLLLSILVGLTMATVGSQLLYKKKS
jgi:uncharacterized repeat protein (TIGR02543 family)